MSCPGVSVSSGWGENTLRASSSSVPRAPPRSTLCQRAVCSLAVHVRAGPGHGEEAAPLHTRPTPGTGGAGWSPSRTQAHSGHHSREPQASPALLPGTELQSS